MHPVTALSIAVAWRLALAYITATEAIIESVDELSILEMASMVILGTIPGLDPLVNTGIGFVSFILEANCVWSLVKLARGVNAD